MNKPLFAWIFSFLGIYEPELKIDAESKSKWTDRMIKSWIYLLFFHHIIEGKFKDPSDDSWKNSYITEKIILRRIAALKQIHGENLTWKASEKGIETSTAPYVQKELKKFESTANLDPTSVLSSSYFFYLRPTTRGKIVESVHKTFMEYLLAEYYIESLLEGKAYRLNTATPSKETILFLDGLIDLLIESQDTAVDKYVDKDETSLLKSFNYYKGREKAKEELITITSKAVNEESITLLNTHDSKEEKVETESDWESIMINVNDYKNLWIDRWISLYILNKLDQNYGLNNSKLLDIIILTSRFTPSYMKNFSKIHFGNCDGIDLSGANISYAEFTGAKLVGANFSYATISEIVTGGGDSPFADFSGANFSHAKLVSVKPGGAELGYVIFSGTNFSHADLSGARLYDSDLTGTKLAFAKLISTDLTRTDLSGARLLGANLTKANLSSTKFIGVDFLHYNVFDSAYFTRANLSDANLSYSNFSNSIMVGANMTRCNLSSAKFINTNLSYSLIIEVEKYDNLLCDGADFSNAIIDNKDLVAYLRNNNAKNVPNALTDIIEIRKKISEDTKKLENTVL